MAFNDFSKFIGLGLFFLGYFYYLGNINLNQFTVFSFSLSAFFFVIADFCEYEMEQVSNEKHWKYKAWRLSHTVFQGLSAVAIILLPHLNPNWDDDFINKVNNTSLLCGLGLTIMLMGFKADNKNSNFIKNLLANYEKLIKSTEKYVETTTKNTEELKKLIDKDND